MEDKNNINFEKRTNSIVQIFTTSLASKLPDPNIFQYLTVPAVKTNFSKFSNSRPSHFWEMKHY